MAMLSRESRTAERSLLSVAEPPAVDFIETEFAYLIDACIPGIRRADLIVDLGGTDVRVRVRIRRRRRIGLLRWRTDCGRQLDYHVSLPAAVERDGMQVRILAGKMWIRIPKAEKSPARILPRVPRPAPQHLRPDIVAGVAVMPLG